MEETKVLGRGQAIASLILGILSIVFLFFGITAPVSIILAIAALCLSKKSKKLGYTGGMRKAGKVLGIIGLILGIIITLALLVTFFAAKAALDSIGGIEGIMEMLNSEEFQEVLNLLDENTKNELIQMINDKNFLGIINNLKSGVYDPILEAFGITSEELMDMAEQLN